MMEQIQTTQSSNVEQSTGTIDNPLYHAPAGESSSKNDVPALLTEKVKADTWYSNIKDENIRGYIESKGFSSIEQLANQYKKMEDLGLAEKANNTLALPKNAEDKEGYDRLYRSLGRPDKAEDYGIAAPEGQDKTFANDMAKTFFEAGLTKAQVDKIVEKYNTDFINAQEKINHDFAVNSQNDLSDLKREWGRNYDNNVVMAQRAIKGLGISTEQLALEERAIGTKAIMEKYRKIGSGLSEDNFKSSSSQNQFLSSEGAKARINELSKDKGFAQRLISGDVLAKDEWARLNSMAID